MSEKDEKLNKGSFLYIGNQDKAEWGYPEGYPYKEHISIDWDGNTDGLVATTGRPGVTYYKISDTLYDVGAITGFTYTVGNDEMSGTDSENPGLLEDGNAWTSPSNMVFCCLTENYTITSYGITFPEPGLYVTGAPNLWIKNVSFAIAHPMASAFLPQATQTTYGAIKKAAHVPHVTEAPTSNDFNKLLSALREAGIMSQSE